MTKPTSRAARAVLAVAVLAVAALAACAPGANPLAQHAAAGQPLAGFWLGLWHGAIVVITFVVSLFTPHVAVYEVHNTGWPYDLGYVLGVIMFHGGGGAGARHRWRSRRVPATDVV